MISLISSPAFVTWLIWAWSKHFEDVELLKGEQLEFVYMAILCIQVFQVVSVLVITFTPNMVYMWNKTYNTYAPKFLYGLQFVIFLVVPIIISLLSVYAIIFCDVRHSVQESWFTLMAVLGLASIIWYYMAIASVVDDIK